MYRVAYLLIPLAVVAFVAAVLVHAVNAVQLGMQP
jgi:hypothetical protein